MNVAGCAFGVLARPRLTWIVILVHLDSEKAWITWMPQLLTLKQAFRGMHRAINGEGKASELQPRGVADRLSQDGINLQQ